MTLLLALELREEQYPRLRPSWLCHGSHSQPPCRAEAAKFSRTLVSWGFPLCPKSHSRTQMLDRRSAGRRLMHADGLELLAPGVGDCRFAAIGQHDWRAVGGVQRIEQRARRELGGLREVPLHVLGADHLHVGDLAAAQKRQCFGRDHGFWEGDVIVRHGTRLLAASNASSPVRVQSVSVMLMVFTIRSGSGRTRSIANSPFLRSALKTSMPSASTNVRWNWRAAMPRWR